MDPMDPNAATWWYFTFGFGQTHAGKYVRIYGSHATAREEMIRRFGIEFCGQYDGADDAGVDRWGYQELDLAEFPECGGDEDAEPVTEDAIPLPACIQDHMSTLDRARVNATELIQAARDIEAIQPQFADLQGLPIIVSPNDDHITLYCYPKAFARVVDLMRVLRQKGYKGKGYVSADGVFHCHMGQVYIYAAFPLSGDACKRVQVGTKEVPVYDIQCDGHDINTSQVDLAAAGEDTK